MPGHDPTSGATSITARFPEDLAAEVAVVARIEGVNVSEVIRAGMYRHVSLLRTDPRRTDPQPQPPVSGGVLSATSRRAMA